MLRQSLLLLPIYLFICSCSNKSEVTNYHENGNIHEQYSISADSLKNGAYKRFRSGGEISETAHYKNGILDGARTLIYENGNVEIEEHYKSDKLHGKYRTFYPSGKKELEMQYLNGEIQGSSFKYFESGQLMEEVYFDKNEENGPFIEYFENGSKKWEGTYLNGENEVGLLQNYNNEGILIKKMMCDSSSVCQTIWTLEKGDITPIQLFDKQ